METLTKSKVKHLRKYLLKKYRTAEGKCFVEGDKLCLEALNNGFSVEYLVYSRGTGKRFQHIIQHPGVQAAFPTSHETIKYLSEVETPQSIIGLVQYRKPGFDPGSKDQHRRYIILDNVSDPGNAGVLLRTASWFGWDGILCSTGCVEITNSKVIRSSMGALFHIPVWERQHLDEALLTLKKRGFNILGSTPRDEFFNPPGMKIKTALVIGNESDGLSGNVQKLCDKLITIPGYGKAESLNAAVSGGILMFQLSKDKPDK